jgi:hypothetical protein
MKLIYKIIIGIFVIFIVLLIAGYFYLNSLGIDYLKKDYHPTKEDFVELSNETKVPIDCFYRIKPEFQEVEIQKGLPNVAVFNESSQQLFIGTCYEDFPFFLDTFYARKKQLKNDKNNFILNERTLKDRVKDIVSLSQNSFLVSEKKYHVVYYFPFMANKKNIPIMKEMYAKYKDSVQFFFVNIDQFESQNK